MGDVIKFPEIYEVTLEEPRFFISIIDEDDTFTMEESEEFVLITKKHSGYEVNYFCGEDNSDEDLKKFIKKALKEQCLI